MEFGYDRERIERLRLEALDARRDYSGFTYYFERALASENTGYPFAVRIGKAIRRMYEFSPTYIGPDELIVGRTPADPTFSPEEEAEWKKLQQAMDSRAKPQGQASHMTIDYEVLLEKGAARMIEEIDEKRKNLDLINLEDNAKNVFYESCEDALHGFIRFGERYADEAERQAQECPDPDRKRELLGIAANLRNVPRNPASSFYEAIQCVQLATYCLSARPLNGPQAHLYQTGRPDRYLAKFYKKDLELGKITPEFAQTLIDCFAVLHQTRISPGLAIGFMVGGRDPKTNSVISNDLTRMGLRSISHVRLSYPGVGFCWCEDTPEEDLRLACQILGEGHSHPAIFNDDVIAKGLQFHGVPYEDSYEYIHSTCVEITPIASSNVWVASPYTNLTKKLLDILPEHFQSMEELLERYFEHLKEEIWHNHRYQIQARNERSAYFHDPFLSCFINDCLKNGKDIEQGGARYNWIMPSFVGLSNLSDALLVLEKLVFSGKISMQELRDALAADFVGHEKLHQLILNLPKYGNDDPEGDKYVLMVTDWITQNMEKHQKDCRTYEIPSLFCWVRHEQFGTETGASPDGRRAGFPFGDGSGPAQGRELEGPTAAVLSSTKWDHHKFIGGIAVNMKFSKKMFNAASLEKMVAIVKTYLERGGFELQINVLDRETLLKALEDPKSYRDVVVRVGGYSDYFVKLSTAMQQEVLARTEYEI